RNPDKIKDAAGQPMWRDISHFSIPDGPLGRTAPYKVAFSHAIMKYSKNQKAAREFLKWLHAKEQFGRWFEIEEGYSVGATTVWENHPMWAKIDAVWLAEIHFQKDRSVLASPLVVAAALATWTRRVKIGIAVQVLPLSHPLRLAEDVATVDHLTKGRLEFGVGRSGLPGHYAGF